MRRLAAITLLAAAPLAAPLAAQMHRVRTPGAVTRAVGVYEWTGDLAKPRSSRLIPVTLFIDGAYQDAGIYLAAPVPLALLPGTEYQLQTTGVSHNFVDITAAATVRAPGSAGVSAYDEGWFGYGVYRIPKPPRPQHVTVADDRPHNRRNSEDDKTVDPDRPTLRRAPVEAGNAKRASRTKDTASVTQKPPSPDDDPDRPVLKRPATQTASGAEPGTVTENGSPMLTDADRPQLHRGRPTGATVGDDDTRMKGMPTDLEQSIAVSDPTDRPEHNFLHSFAAPEEKAQVMQALETMARAVLANPSLARGAANPTATPDATLARLAAQQQASAATRPVRKPTATHPPAHLPAHNVRRPASAAPAPLENEQMRAFDLSYNSAPTYVLSAESPDAAGHRHFVTVIAQPDALGDLQPAFRILTDENHLDSTPRLRLVDAVDADASSRASLLFELRSAHARQFALYQVFGGRTAQTWVTGTTQ